MEGGPKKFWSYQKGGGPIKVFGISKGGESKNLSVKLKVFGMKIKMHISDLHP